MQEAAKVQDAMHQSMVAINLQRVLQFLNKLSSDKVVSSYSIAWNYPTRQKYLAVHCECAQS